MIDELGGLNRFITTGKSDRPIYLGAWQPRVGASYDVTGNNRTVNFTGPAHLRNELVQLRITEARSHSLRGELL